MAGVARRDERPTLIPGEIEAVYLAWREEADRCCRCIEGCGCVGMEERKTRARMLYKVWWGEMEGWLNGNAGYVGYVFRRIGVRDLDPIALFSMTSPTPDGIVHVTGVDGKYEVACEIRK